MTQPHQSPRWRAVATYRSETGLIDVQHDIEELEEIDQLIEAGPDWNALIDLRITLANPCYPGATLEECERIGQMTGAQLDEHLARRPSA